jgi:hypothetical protein
MRVCCVLEGSVGQSVGCGRGRDGDIVVDDDERVRPRICGLVGTEGGDIRVLCPVKHDSRLLVSVYILGL